jgi:hypothetical protein
MQTPTALEKLDIINQEREIARRDMRTLQDDLINTLRQLELARAENKRLVSRNRSLGIDYARAIAEIEQLKTAHLAMAS